MSFAALYLYGSVFLWMFFTGLGIPPVPEELAILYPVGLTAEHPEIRWWLAWSVTVSAILSADAVLYSIGRLWGRRLLRYQWMQRILPPHREESIERGFHRHGIKILVIARLLPPLRTSVFITAGLIKYPFSRYMLADSFVAIFTVAFVFLGLGSLWELIKRLGEHFRNPLAWVIAFLLLAVGGYVLYRYLRFVHRRTTTDNLEPPHFPQLIHPHAPAQPAADSPPIDKPTAERPK